MAGQGDGDGAGVKTLDSQITSIKYVLFFMNILAWMIGAAVFGLTMWLRFDNGITEWITSLELPQFYIGVYILILASVIVMGVSFIGCGASLMESESALMIFILSQIVGFVIGVAGSATLLEFSTYDSSIQPLIRESFRKLIVASGHHEPSKMILHMVQENIGCCGADGPNDYLTWRQPMPTTCRDSVTGNAYFYGCVDELTWFFEEKAGWVVALSMTVCFMHVINAVLALILMQALKKENYVPPYHQRNR